MLEELEQIGLSKNEAKIYLALLKIGPSTSGKIIKETGIHVSAVYYALDNLIKKGLATYVSKANRKHFQASDPEQLSLLLEEKEKILDKVIPDLENIQKPIEEPVITIVHEGYKGFKGVYDKILKTLKKGEEYSVFGARQIGDPSNETLNTMLINYHKQREKKGIKVKLIFNEDVRERILKKTKSFRYIELKFMKTPTNSHTVIYADRVVNFLFTKRLIAIEIISEEIAKSYKEFFKLMWQGAKS